MKIVLFIVPLILLITGGISKFWPVKKMNGVMGYRSAKSLSSQENWDKAQQLMAKYMLIIGVAEVVITELALMITGTLSDQNFILFLSVMTVIQVIGAVLVIPLVESKLN